jgi:hypothetical protein
MSNQGGCKVNPSPLRSILDHVDVNMGYEEEVVNFIDDPLEGQVIWSSLVVGCLDVLWDSNKLHHFGSKPLKEAIVAIIGDLVEELSVHGVKTSSR